METPEFHLRIVSDSEAMVFRVSLNDQRRIKWERCASFSMKSGEITMQDNMPVPQGLPDFCETWLSSIAQEKDRSGVVYEALTAMGKLANMAGKLDSPIDGYLFETLIWSEANLKNVLIANNGLAMLGEDDQEKYILQGLHHMDEGKYHLAETEFLKALEYNANRANVHSFLSISLERQGKIEEAAVAINQSISADPNRSRFIMRGAHYNLEAGNLEKSQTYIKQLAKQKGMSAAQMLHLSRFAVRAGLITLGRELAEAIVDGGNHDEEVIEHLVNIEDITEEEEEEVFRIVRQHFNTLPTSPRLREWYIRSLISIDNLDLALQETEVWIASDNKDAQAHFQLGRVCLAMKNPESALHALRIAEELSPNHAPTQMVIADVCILLGDLAGAVEASRRACKLDPENVYFINQSKQISTLHRNSNMNAPKFKFIPQSTELSIQDISFRMQSIKTQWGEDDPILVQIREGTFDEYRTLNYWSFLVKNAPANSVVLDVGAYAGLFTLISATTRSDLLTVAFEPSSVTFGRLVSNIQINGLNRRVIPAHMAAWDAEEVIKLPHKYGIFILCPGESSGRHSEVDHTETVLAIPLDHLKREEKPDFVNSKNAPQFGDRKVALMKLDVEGVERRVLEGAVSILKTDRPVLIVEFLNKTALDSLTRFFTANGYSVTIIEGERNIIAIPEEEVGLMENLENWDQQCAQEGKQLKGTLE